MENYSTASMLLRLEFQIQQLRTEIELIKQRIEDHKLHEGKVSD